MLTRWARLRALLLLSTLFAFLAFLTGSGCPPTPPGPCPIGATPQISPIRVATTPTLQGWVDLHTHPVANLGFAGKLVYGGLEGEADGGALVATDPDCNDNVTATSPEQALGHCGSTHGYPWQSPCGDAIRALVVDTLNQYLKGNQPGTDSTGYPDFGSWPKWNELTHQVMWIDWLKRAFLGGMRVMVALAVNNKTLADTVAGPGDGPDDDMRSADKQLAQITALAARHSDWMAIAYKAEDIPTILKANKLAIVMGLEVDNLGDFNFNGNANPTEAEVHAEIARLYGEGVRYIFPIHVIDNVFGTSAAYVDLFNLSNLREAGHFYNLVCSSPEDLIGYQYTMGNPLQEAQDPFSAGLLNVELAVALVVKLGMADDANDEPTVPTCDTPMTGMVNRGTVYPGLTPLGKFAILDMMSQGIFVDIDHMSQAAATDAVALAIQENYPVNSGHNEVRTYSAMPNASSERNLSSALYAQIGRLHGMAGVGVANTDELNWISQYQAVLQALGDGGAAAGFGTDTNGLSPLMPPPPAGTPLLEYNDAGFAQSGLGCATWNYNDAGVANYGMLADLVQALPLVPGGAGVQANLIQGAQYFYDTWKIIDAYRAAHQAGGGITPAVVRGPPRCPPPRRIDEWGLCVPATPPRAASGSRPAGPLPAARRLLPGPYSLMLAARSGTRAAGEPTETFGFAVDPGGRLVGLDGSGPAGVKASGELRGHLFVMRVRAGAQRLALIAQATEGQPTEMVRGGFAAYTPGTSVVTGSFVLRRELAGASSPDLVAVGPFLESLHK